MTRERRGSACDTVGIGVGAVIGIGAGVGIEEVSQWSFSTERVIRRWDRGRVACSREPATSCQPCSLF